MVELVRLGFHGLALAMLILGWRLLRELVVQRDQGEATGLQEKLKSVRFFLIISLAFLITGAALELLRHSQENELKIYVTPAPLPSGIPRPGILAETESLSLDPELLIARTFVRQGSSLHLRLQVIVEKIRQLESELQTLRILSGNCIGGLDEPSGGGLDDP